MSTVFNALIFYIYTLKQTTAASNEESKFRHFYRVVIHRSKDEADLNFDVLMRTYSSAMGCSTERHFTRPIGYPLNLYRQAKTYLVAFK